MNKRETRPYAIALTAFLGTLATLVPVIVALPTATERPWQTHWG